MVNDNEKKTQLTNKASRMFMDPSEKLPYAGHNLDWPIWQYGGHRMNLYSNQKEIQEMRVCGNLDMPNLKCKQKRDQARTPKVIC